jgi:hypothetical protein
MNWQSQLEKTVIALNLIGLALGFGTLGILILVKEERGGESWISGVLGILVGSLFLLFAVYFCRHTWGVVAGPPKRRRKSSSAKYSARLGSTLGLARSLAPAGQGTLTLKN